MKALKLTTFLAVVGMFACDQADPLTPVNPGVVPMSPTTPAGNGPERPNFDPVDVTMQPGEHVSVLPAPVAPPGLEVHVRSRRRMDIDQLDAAIQRVSGGIGWTDSSGRNQFTVLAATLGKPDYAFSTQEDLTPSAMFQKFLNDAARSVCFKLVDREQMVPAAERVFFVEASLTDSIAQAPEKIEANLKHVLLRFHGRSLTMLGGELEQWRWLYQSAEHISQDPVVAWRTVCVALLIHPDFYLY